MISNQNPIKSITLFKNNHINNYIKSKQGHINPSQKSDFTSSYGILTCQSRTYFGYMISNRLFITSLKEIEEKSQKQELNSLKKSSFSCGLTEKVNLKRVFKVLSTRIILVLLDKDIGKSIGYRGLSDIENNLGLTMRIIVNFSEKSELSVSSFDFNSLSNESIVYSYYNEEYYISQIGETIINKEIILYVNKLYKKSLHSLAEVVGIYSNSKLTMKKMRKFNFQRIVFINKENYIENMKNIQHMISLTELIFEKNQVCSLFLKRNIKVMSTFKLKGLSFKSNQIKNEGVEYLSRLDLSKLIKLNLSEAEIEDEAFSFFSKTAFSNLIYLDLYNNKINSEGMKFLSYIDFRLLKYLDLESNKIDSEGMKFFSNMTFPYLKYLDLGRNFIGNEGMCLLSKMELSKLEQLYIQNNRIESEGFGFFSMMRLPRIQFLDIGSNRFGDEGMKFLCQNKDLSHVKYLFLYNSLITMQGIAYLSKVRLGKLQYLDLDRNQIQNDGLKILCNMDLSHVLYLYISNNKINDDGVGFILGLNCKSLLLLDVSMNFISKGDEIRKKLKVKEMKY